MEKLHTKRYGDKLPENVAQRRHEDALDELMKEIDGRTRSVNRIERIILTPVDPIYDDLGAVINADDNAALRARIETLERRLAGEDVPAPSGPPKQITFDRGPLPPRVDPEILGRFLRLIRDNVPHPNQRTPEAGLGAVLTPPASAEKAKDWQTPPGTATACGAYDFGA